MVFKCTVYFEETYSPVRLVMTVFGAQSGAGFCYPHPPPPVFFCPHIYGFLGILYRFYSLITVTILFSSFQSKNRFLSDFKITFKKL